MEGLRLEWDLLLPQTKDKTLYSIYFGGGTPALLGPERVSEILNWINSSVPSISNPEVTLEANPENIERSLFEEYRQAGINRISVGIQSFNDPLLQVLGRTHNASKASQSIEDIYKAGFENISVDLMYDLPGQSLNVWKETVKVATDLPITHVSLYNLTFEPETVFFKKRKTLQPLLPDPEISTEMATYAFEALSSQGFQQYEISAFAKKGFQAQHNTGYWTGRPFLGMGPSAFSYWEGKRYRNRAHLGKYVEALKKQETPVDFEEHLDDEASRRELLAIHLRLLEGCDLNLFQNEHGHLPEETLQAVKKLVDDGYLERDGALVKLTGKGILFYDAVATDII